MPATVIAVLLAGNDATIEQIDPLLEQLQIGVANISHNGEQATPDVYCFYERKADGDDQPTTYRCRLNSNTFEFANRRLTSFDPTGQPGFGSLTGNLKSDVVRFLLRVSKHQKARQIAGPIRMICGAHGRVSHGISGRKLQQLLMQHLDDADDAKQLQDPDQWTNAWRRIGEQLRRRLLHDIPLPYSLNAAVEPGASRLTLDQLGGIFRKLQRHSANRLQTLIMHACQLSSLEAIKALSGIPQHIACATQLKSSPMRLSEWFERLIDHQATDEELTEACFDNLRQVKQNADGHFSSHRTKKIDAVLRALNRLGKLFLDRMGNADFEQAVALAQADSWNTAHCVDIARFCELLRESEYCELLWQQGQGELRFRLLSLETRVQELQLASCQAANDPWQPPVKNRGINVAFPDRHFPVTKAELPKRFVRKASRWCEFVELWSA